MHAVTALPRQRGRVDAQEVPEPAEWDSAVLVRGQLMGVRHGP